jgi:hypothetical protein
MRWFHVAPGKEETNPVGSSSHAAISALRPMESSPAHLTFFGEPN